MSESEKSFLLQTPDAMKIVQQARLKSARSKATKYPKSINDILTEWLVYGYKQIEKKGGVK